MSKSSVTEFPLTNPYLIKIFRANMSTTKKNTCEGECPEHPTQKRHTRPLLKNLPCDRKNVFHNPEQNESLKNCAQLKAKKNAKNLPCDRKNVFHNPEQSESPKNCAQLKEKKNAKKAERISNLSQIVAEEFQRFHVDRPLRFTYNKDKRPPCHETQGISKIDAWNYEFAKIVAEVEQSRLSSSKKDNSPPLHNAGRKFDIKKTL